jgi:hypothetical protein
MRTTLLAIFLATLTCALPALGNELDFSLISNIGVESAPDNTLAATPLCLVEPGCILFSGSLTDNDTDGSYILTGPDSDFGLSDITVTFSSLPTSGGLTLDNTWDDFADAGVLIGDPNAATDGDGAPNLYTGPLFGIDIAPGTTPGRYTGTVTIEAQHLDPDFDPIGDPFTVSQQFTVDVVPEPASWGFALAGLMVLGAWCRLRKKWPFFEASR